MSAELRPSSLGEILDRTAQMYRSSFLLYFGISALASAAILIPRLIAYTSISLTAHGNTQRFQSLSVAVSMVMSLLYLVPMALSIAALVFAVSASLRGESTNIRQAYASIRPRWYRYLLVMLATYTYAFLPIFLLLVPSIVLLRLEANGVGRLLAPVVLIVLVVGGIFAAVWWLLRWSLSIPAMVSEGLKVHRSMKRSAVLTKGARGRIFVMLLLVLAVVMVITYAVQVPMFILLVTSKGRLTLATQVLSSCGVFLSSSFVTPIWAIALTLFYYDQRIRKEGYDVEWLMAQADAAALAANANATPPPATPPPATLTAPLNHSIAHAEMPAPSGPSPAPAALPSGLSFSGSSLSGSSLSEPSL
jgi:Membrane domain of glycerophosphoryl diester phosphodiesterase